MHVPAAQAAWRGEVSGRASLANRDGWRARFAEPRAPSDVLMFRLALRLRYPALGAQAAAAARSLTRNSSPAIAGHCDDTRRRAAC